MTTTDTGPVLVDFDPAAVAATITGEPDGSTPRDRRSDDADPLDPADPNTYAGLVMRAAKPRRDVALAVESLPAETVAPLRAALAAHDRDYGALVALADEADEAARDLAEHRRREREAVAAASSGAKVTRLKPLDADALAFAADVRLARACAAFADCTRSARAVEAAFDALAPALVAVAVERVEAAGKAYAEAVTTLRLADDAQSRAVAFLAALHRVEAMRADDPHTRREREAIVRAWHFGLTSARPVGAIPDAETPSVLSRLAARAMTGEYLDAIAAGPGALPTSADVRPSWRPAPGGSDVPPGVTE